MHTKYNCQVAILVIKKNTISMLLVIIISKTYYFEAKGIVTFKRLYIIYESFIHNAEE